MCRPSSSPTIPAASHRAADTSQAPHPPPSTDPRAAPGRSCDTPPPQSRALARPCRDCPHAAPQIRAAQVIHRTATHRSTGSTPSAPPARHTDSRSAVRLPRQSRSPAAAASHTASFRRAPSPQTAPGACRPYASIACDAQNAVHLVPTAQSSSTGGSMRDEYLSVKLPPTGAKLAS